MFHRKNIIGKTALLAALLWSALLSAQPLPDKVQLAVWANEAIVATYTFNHKNFLTRQKEIARYFTAAGWIAYSAALNASTIPSSVMKNAYSVSAVASLPPKITIIKGNEWEATMPLLVLYENPQYQQKQQLQVTIRFAPVPSGQGIRGLAISSLQAKNITPPCKCAAPAQPNEK